MTAYQTALTLLARRELSVRQLRQRLARRDFDAAEVDAAIARLVGDRTLDDFRVALAMARMHAAIKGRGRRRVLQAVQHLGIDAETAERAVAEVFGEVDEGALLATAIAKRLKGASLAALDAHGKARLVRQLVAQGFAPAHVLRAIRDLRG